MAIKGDQTNPSANDKAGGEGRDVGTPTQLAENLAHGDNRNPAVAMAHKGESRPSGEHPDGVYGSLNRQEDEGDQGSSEEGSGDGSRTT